MRGTPTKPQSPKGFGMAIVPCLAIMPFAHANANVYFGVCHFYIVISHYTRFFVFSILLNLDDLVKKNAVDSA